MPRKECRLCKIRNKSYSDQIIDGISNKMELNNFRLYIITITIFIIDLCPLQAIPSNLILSLHILVQRPPSTVELPIADSPRSGSPLYSGQNTIPRMNLPYNTRTSNLRKAATSELSRTNNRGIPFSHVQHKITSINGQTTTPPN